MGRLLTLGIIGFIVGCGEGPKHIAKADYQHGKAAFEMLERYDKTSSGSFGLAALQQNEQVKDLDLLTALANYSISIDERSERRLEGNDSLDEISPIVKLCRDDVAQYFDASAASTNTCDSNLKAYRAKHDIKKE